MVAALLLIIGPDHILIGGGVGRRPELLSHVRDEAVRLLANYRPDYCRDTIKEVVRHAQLGEDVGPLGAIAVARTSPTGQGAG